MRGRRRQDEERSKGKARRLILLWSRHRDGDSPTAREIGRIASTHGRPCSCWMCRGHKDVAPRRERGFDPDAD